MEKKLKIPDKFHLKKRFNPQLQTSISINNI
jgi:hypothetical protein